MDIKSKEGIAVFIEANLKELGGDAYGVDYVAEKLWEWHESELKKLRVGDVNGSVCYCGKPSVEECEPCCSLACALKPKMYR